MQQYWVVYAFLTVFESAVNAVYWFRKRRRDHPYVEGC